ncbi:hypothetical protein DFH07DRAFT_772369 [Mycena maculata]|uniref:Uncharacterized protein n=1 Tax=Mycena maculata TaxID=230809 RepID=A0AAD7JBE3_9AGAR|nr:hypothetical protein DFH07DRAFT_772369 [Mycena maculata]
MKHNVGGSKSMASWPGFGLRDRQVRPKAKAGQNFGLALALVPKPKSPGFLARGQSENITKQDTEDTGCRSSTSAELAAGRNEPELLQTFTGSQTTAGNRKGKRSKVV